MDHRWLSKEEDKEAQKKRVLAAKAILHEAAEILESLFEEGVPDYNNPSWGYAQADRNGANRKLREVIKFLKV